jgi:cyclic pyranopterin phosphate synthase
MPAEGVKLLPHNEILSFDEIVDVIKYGVEHGIDKVRITGGEPLVRKGIVDLISMIAKIKGIKDLAMTTNGILLNKYAEDLATAGLHRVNISLDTLDEQKFNSITRVGKLQDVLSGIEAAVKAGLTPVKLNCVIKKSSLEPDAQMVAQYAKDNGLQVRFIPEMDLGKGDFGIVQGGDGGNCAICNRLRLTANGMLKPCLFSDIAYSVRELGISEAYNMALKNKPLSGHKNKTGQFYNIGG